MGRLVMVRHGQASFMAKNYDVLSPVGEEQAARLGQDWARRGTRFDRVITGPCVRQRDTMRAVAEAGRAAGLEWPEAETMAEFDEFPGEQILTAGLAQMMDREPRVQALQEAFLAAATPETRRATFQKVFEEVMRAWALGRLDIPGVESWADFTARVGSGLLRVVESSGRVVVFTSGGPIGVAMGRAMELSDERTMELAWMSRNASWSEFLFASAPAERFTLSTFNSFGHFDDPVHLTYR